jgi:hypothetical protein
MLGNYRVAAQLVATRVELCSTELVRPVAKQRPINNSNDYRSLLGLCTMQLYWDVTFRRTYRLHLQASLW